MENSSSKSFTDFFINRPVFSWVLNIIIMLLGITAFFHLSTRQYPRMDRNSVTAEITAADTAVQVLEQQVTFPLEEAFSSINGLKELSSTTTKGEVKISVDFEKRSIDNVASDVQDILHREREKIIRRLHIANLEMVVRKGGDSDTQVMELAITNPNISLTELYYVGEKMLKTALEAINGVAAVKVYGGSEYKMKVSIDPLKMMSHNVTPKQIQAALEGNNFQLAAGYLMEPEKEYTITAQSNLKSPKDFENITVSYQNNRFVRLGDVASVSLRSGEESDKVFYNKTPAIGIDVVSQADANPIDIAAEVRLRIKKIENTLAKGTKVNVVVDNSLYIKESINQVYHALLEAMILVFVVIFFFLRSFRASLVPLITIPIALLGTFFLMDTMGFTINVLSLLAMVLAIGLVVDDAIVVLENIYRYLERGFKPFQAAILGTREIGFSVIAMTLTLVAVYAPIAITPGAIGRAFREFALTLAGAVLLSGITALTLSPVMCAYLLRPHKQVGQGAVDSVVAGAANETINGAVLGEVSLPHAPENTSFLQRKLGSIFHIFRIFSWLGEKFSTLRMIIWLRHFFHTLSMKIESMLNGLDATYGRWVSKVLGKKALVLLTAIVFSGGCFMYGWLGMRKETAPPSDEGLLTVSFNKGANRNMKYFLQRADKIQDIIGTFPQIGKGMLIVQSGDDSFYYAPLIPWAQRKESCQEIADDLRKKLQSVQGIHSYPSCPSAPMFQGGSDDFPLSFSLLTNRSNDELSKMAKRLKDDLETIPGVNQVDRREYAKVPEYNVVLLSDRINQLHINPMDVAENLRLLFGRGIIAGTFLKGSEQCDITMEMDDRFRSSLDSLSSLSIQGNVQDEKQKPKTVPLSELIEFQSVLSDAAIRHFGKKRAYDIGASIKPGYGLANVYLDFQEKIRPILPEGYEIVPQGDLKTYFAEQGVMLLIFGLALIFIFLIMAAQFESVRDPFIIMLSVPLALSGALFSLWFLPNGSLNIYSVIGLITLIGLITKHGILLVDFANENMAQGISPEEAILKSCTLRLRPILMTTLAMVLGAVPLLLAKGAGCEARQQIGCVIVGGMTIGTLFTLFFIPVIYVMFKGKAVQNVAKA